MIEKALLTALVALALIVGLSAVAEGIHKVADRIGCALDGATVCILDDAKES